MSRLDVTFVPVKSVVRFALVLAAIGILAVAQDQSRARSLRSAEDRSFHLELWGASLGLVAVGGLVFGLAVWLPSQRTRYKWTRAVLLGIVPLLLMAHFAFVFGFALPHRWAGPALLLQMRFYFSYGPQFSLAILTGLAVASGFAPDVPRAGADNSSSSRLM